MIDYDIIARDAQKFVDENGHLADGASEGTVPFSDSPQDIAEFVAEGALDGADMVQPGNVPYDTFVSKLAHALRRLRSR